jgi:hypothetical protein
MGTIDKIKEETARLEEEFKKATSQPSEGFTEEQPEQETAITQEASSQDTQQDEEESLETWIQRYKTLKGKYDKEVPRLHQELRQLRDENAFMRSKLELLEQMVIQKSQSQPSDTSEQESGDPEIEQLKEDFPEIYRAITKLLERVTKKVVTKDEIKQVEDKVTQATFQTFYNKLDTLVPDWRTLNEDPDFLAWLNDRDPFTGRTKLELLRLAYQEGDADRVAIFFNEYKKQRQSSPQNDLSKLASPPRGRHPSTVVGGSTNKPFFTEEQITDFYLRKAQGKIPKAEADRIEREIIQASKEGRIKLGG